MVQCESKLCSAIFENLFPLLGLFTSYFIFLSPFKQIQNLRNKGQCTLNPIPCVMIFCNCLSQTLYSYTIHNHWNFWPNFGGLILGLYYIIVLYSSNLKQNEWDMSTITLIGTTILNFIGGAFTFIFFNGNYEAGKICMGMVGIIILCGVYVSPLTTIFEVINSRDSSSISFIMTIALFINAIFWGFYGIFYNDFFIWFPNVLGVLSSIVQYRLIRLYPRKRKDHMDDELPMYNNTIDKDDEFAEFNDIEDNGDHVESGESAETLEATEKDLEELLD